MTISRNISQKKELKLIETLDAKAAYSDVDFPPLSSDHYTGQVMILALIGSITIVAYAASILFSSTHSNTDLTKDRYIEGSFTDAEVTGSIKPGGTVNIAPVVTNNGDITCYAFIIALCIWKSFYR